MQGAPGGGSHRRSLDLSPAALGPRSVVGRHTIPDQRMNACPNAGARRAAAAARCRELHLRQGRLGHDGHCLAAAAPKARNCERARRELHEGTIVNSTLVY